uniref:Putative methyltransferase n=1 Tax=viral metagenome TaxID=1070528 RepID=A0A6M3Y5Q4_9ZZZZ
MNKELINKIICGECLEVMKDMPDKSVDLVLTDPPYGVNFKYDKYEDTEENWYNLIDKVIPEMRRIATMVIMPSCQIKRLDWFYKNHKPDWLICWYKGSVGHSAYIGFNDWEPHLVWGKNNTNMHDYFRATPEPFKNGHPCPKPIEWAKWIISRATKEDDIVLDPFIGSGTTAVACQNLKRNFIGIEISKEYVKIAEERLRQKPLL